MEVFRVGRGKVVDVHDGRVYFGGVLFEGGKIVEVDLEEWGLMGRKASRAEKEKGGKELGG